MHKATHNVEIEVV